MHKTVLKSTHRKKFDISYAMPSSNIKNKTVKLNNYYDENNRLAPISPKVHQNLTPGNDIDNSVTS